MLWICFTPVAIKIHELIEVTLKAVENGNDKVKETAETLNTIVDI